jgi:NAD-dependent SIR2 family protein deacetylase
MGNEPSRPEPEEAVQLQAGLADSARMAAEAIAAADVFVLFTGAGFSADSGLSVYKDIADVKAYREEKLTYMGLCDPDWLESDPEIFFGFWGACFNDYRDTRPHTGYAVLSQWADRFRHGVMGTEIQRRLSGSVETKFGDYVPSAFSGGGSGDRPGAFFLFTSNVDAHSFQHFRACEIKECHGNTERWQCSHAESGCCGSGVWRAPAEFRFDVDKATMRAPAERAAAAAEAEAQALPLAAPKASPAAPPPPPSYAPTKPAEAKAAGSPPATGPGARAAHVDTARAATTPAMISATAPATTSAMNTTKKDAADNTTASNHAEKDAVQAAVKGKGPDQGTGQEERKAAGYSHSFSNRPTCSACGALARPNVLMFNDGEWSEDAAQHERYKQWEASMELECASRLSHEQAQWREGMPSPRGKATRIVVLEIGAGDNVPTVRNASERMVQKLGDNLGVGAQTTFIRINPELPLADDKRNAERTISLMAPGLKAVGMIDEHLQRIWKQEAASKMARASKQADARAPGTAE